MSFWVFFFLSPSPTRCLYAYKNTSFFYVPPDDNDGGISIHVLLIFHRVLWFYGAIKRQFILKNV